MEIDKKKLIKRFNRAFSTFDSYAILHQQMAHRLLISLQKNVPYANRILEIGCGTGYLTQLLIDFYPEANIKAVDFAKNMIGVAKEKVGSLDRVQFVLDDAEDMVKVDRESYDLIISNATIHLLQKPKETLRMLYQRLKPEGWLLATTFGPDTLQEFVDLFVKAQSELQLEPQRPILKIRSGQEWEDIFKEVELSEISTEEFWQRLEYEDCCHFLHSVHSTGNSYNEPEQNFIMLRKILEKVIQRYNLAYRSKQGVYATYHMMQVSGKKR